MRAKIIPSQALLKMSWIARRLLILDTAGTIISPQSPNCAIHRTLKAVGLSHPVLTDRQIAKDMGMTKEVHLRNLIEEHFPKAPPSALREALDLYPSKQLEVFRESPELSQAIAHTAPALDSLRKRFDMQIMLTSGFPRSVFDFILKRLYAQGITFDFNICSSEAHSRAEMLRVCLSESQLHVGSFVGDTKNDMKAGVSVKSHGERIMYTIGIAGNSAEGTNARYELTTAQADVVIENLGELLDLPYFCNY
jgi:phosphoglycolate phosphatase-like HAD superfamily hydrolase